MKFVIDAQSSTPKNEQLRNQIQDAVKSGSLAAGAKLPTVRSLAAELGLAPYTVARAYRELEDLAVVETHGRNGTIVSTFGDETERQAQAAAHAFAERIRLLGVAPAKALDLVKAALQG